MEEDFYILKNIIIKGLQKGFGPTRDKNVINSADMVSGDWVLSNGASLGSTWDIILSSNFAKAFWGDDYESHMTSLVVLNSEKRIDYLKQFVDNELDTSISENTQIGFVVTNENFLMSILQESLERIKKYSTPLYIETCNDKYNELQGLIKKTSVTELIEEDFLLMNSMNQIMSSYGLAKYLNATERSSFTFCPECGEIDFNHLDGCSIKNKSTQFLINQNEGC